MIVLDASACVELLLRTSLGQDVLGRLQRDGETWHAPHLLDLEVAQVLRRFVRAGQVTGTRAAAAIEDLCDLDLTRYPHDVLLPRIWHLRGRLTAYDAAYVVLAEALGAVLLTTDRRLASTAGRAARIEVVGP